MSPDRALPVLEMNHNGSRLTLEAVASRLAVGRTTVQRLIRSGRLPAFKPHGSNRVYVRADDLLRYQQQQGPVTEQARAFAMSRRQSPAHAFLESIMAAATR